MCPLYSKNEVRKAGGIFRSANPVPDDLAWADGVLAHWRRAHEEPLEQIMTLLNSVKPEGSTVASRLKRIDTIRGKLRRAGQHHELDTMYDIAGCRVIVPKLDDIQIVSDALSNLIETVKVIDYIEHPKVNGYRSLHIISRHESPHLGYSNLRVETQIRTSLQHSWATAVESYDLISGSHLKFGNDQTIAVRFFALAANALAIVEGAQLVPGLPRRIDELSDELRRIDGQSRILDKLDAFSQSMRSVTEGNVDSSPAYYMICLSLDDQQVLVKPIFDSENSKTMAVYGAKEREKNAPDDVLLVKASSIEALQTAYPNYFSNIDHFIDVLIPILERGRG